MAIDKRVWFYLKYKTQSQILYVINEDCEVFEKLPEIGFTADKPKKIKRIRKLLPDANHWNIDLLHK